MNDVVKHAMMRHPIYSDDHETDEEADKMRDYMKQPVYENSIWHFFKLRKLQLDDKQCNSNGEYRVTK